MKIKKNFSCPKVSIIIRTYNESFWIKILLKSLFAQNYKNFSIVIIDSQSNDDTLRIIKANNLKTIKIINKKKYTPGKAINMGIGCMPSDYTIVLSSHCIPASKNWITEFVDFMNENISLVAAGGRQLPLPGTNPANFIDLHNTFRNESKIYKSDPYLSNANAIYRTSVLLKNKFNEHVSNIEDQLWANTIIKKMKKQNIIGYTNQAEVFHYHGIHQHLNPSKRAISTSKTIENLYRNKWRGTNFLYKENINFALIVNARSYKIATKIDKDLKKLLSINIFKKIKLNFKTLYTSIPYKNKKINSIQNKPTVNLRENLLLTYNRYRTSIINTDYCLYLRLDTYTRNKDLEELINKCCFETHDSLTFAEESYKNFQIDYPNGTSIKSFNLESRDIKPLLTTYNIGKGCVFKVDMLRNGSVINENVSYIND